jgi:hypothetical protein
VRDAAGAEFPGRRDPRSGGPEGAEVAGHATHLQLTMIVALGVVGFSFAAAVTLRDG